MGTFNKLSIKLQYTDHSPYNRLLVVGVFLKQLFPVVGF